MSSILNQIIVSPTSPVAVKAVRITLVLVKVLTEPRLEVVSCPVKFKDTGAVTLTVPKLEVPA